MILLRDLFSALLRGIGRLVLLVAAMSFATAVGLSVLAGFLLTFPIARISPRSERMKAFVELIQVGYKFASTFTPPNGMMPQSPPSGVSGTALPPDE